MDTMDNRRQSLRYIRHDKLFVQILSASEAVDVSDKTMLCHSCDASMNGMRIEMGTELAVDSLVDVWASFRGIDEKFYLRGHVCWCYELGGETDSYQLGIELEDAYATDYSKWVELLQSFSEEYSQPLS